MKESDISRAIQIEATKQGYRLFRQNVGLAWVGEVIRRTKTQVTLIDPRPLRAGLCRGSSDLIGWVTVSIGGRDLAILCAVEVKTPRGKVSDVQQNFIDRVNAAGGIAIIARSPDEAMEKIAAAIAALNT